MPGKESHHTHSGPEPALRVVAMPKDTNSQGDIFGGWIMSQIDIAGAVAASNFTESRVVTVAVKEIVFKKPVFVGDLISCYAEVVKVGKTSITVTVEVCARRLRHKKECIPVTEATVVYVSIDDNGIPVEIRCKNVRCEPISI